MENAVERTQLTAEGTTWEIALSELRFVDGVVGVDWELNRLSGDSVVEYAMELRRNGNPIDRFESKPIGAFVRPEPNNSGRLGGSASPGDSLTLRMVADDLELATLTATVPQDDSGSIGRVASPVPIPTWADPFGTVQEIVVPEVESWTEAKIEGLSVEGDPRDESQAEYPYTIRVSGDVKYGDGEQIERTIGLVKAPGAVGSGALAEHTVTLDPGETVEITGVIDVDKRLEIRAEVLDPAYGDHSVADRDATVPDLWQAEPLETIQIPEPHPLPSSLAADEQSLHDALAYPPSIDPDKSRAYNFDPNNDNTIVDGGRADHYFVSGRTVGDRNLIDAVLAWREGKIDDEQMSKVHALWEYGEVGVEWYRNTGNTLAGVVEGDDQQTIKIHHNRHTHYDVIRLGGPGVWVEKETDRANDNRISVSGCVPGAEYELVKPYRRDDPKPPVEGYVSETLNLLYSPPEPEPDPDPDPVPPDFSIACALSDTTITAGETATVPVDVTTGDGTTDDSATVQITVAGETVEESVTLGPNDSTRVEATYQIDEPGDYTPTVTLE